MFQSESSELFCCLCNSSYFPVKVEADEDEADQEDNCNPSPQNCFASFLKELQLNSSHKAKFSVDESNVCPCCLEEIRRAMRTKWEMEKVEKHVRELQLQIAAAMKQVAGLLGQFSGEMKGIERIGKGSGRKVIGLQNQLDRRKYNKDVMNFRRGITDVVESLSNFKSELATKNLNHDNSNSVTSTTETVKPALKSKTSYSDDEEDEDFVCPPEDEGSDDSYHEYEVPEVGIEKKTSNISDRAKLEDLDQEIATTVSTSLENDDIKINDLIKNKVQVERQIAKKYNIKFSTMSSWKRQVLPRLLYTTSSIKIPTKCSNGEIKFCAPTKQYDVQYDNSTGQVLYGSYRITFRETEKKLVCGYCDYVVNTTKLKCAPKYIIEHILGNHLGAYTCIECGASYKSCNKFRVHLNSHKKPFTCEICAKPLSTPEYVRTHLWTHMNKEEQEEAVRNGEKDRRLQWDRYKIKYAAKNFVCSVCGTKFRTAPQLKSHEEVHLNLEEREKFLCPDCGKVFLRHESFLRHQNRKKSLVGLLPCDRCCNGFKSESSLKNHKYSVHGVQDSKHYRCTLCPTANQPTEYHTKTAYMVHIKKVHENKKVWACLREGCGREFMKKSRLLKHQNRRFCVKVKQRKSS